MLWTCLECTTRYAWGLRACPHCGSAERLEDGMAKITVHGGPSDARDVVVPEDNVVSESDEGSDQPSPGTSSSASTEKTPTTSVRSSPTRRRRARTTESPSSLDPEASSSASSTTTTNGPVTGGDEDDD